MSFALQRPLNAAGAVLFAATMLSACAGKIGTNDTPVAEGELASELAQSICEGLRDCCGRGAFSYDREGCVAATKAQVQTQLDGQKSKNTTYDASTARKCVQKGGEDARACTYPDMSGSALLSSWCNAVYVGTKKPSEACERHSDCEPSAAGIVFCEPLLTESGAAPSQCRVHTPALRGAACGFRPDGGWSPVTSECVTSSATLYCHRTSATCQPRIEVGEACDADGGNTCVPGARCSDGICVSGLAAGAPCTALQTCGAGLFCEGVHAGAGTCAARKSAGQACTKGDGACADGRCSQRKCSAGFADADVCAGTHVGPRAPLG